jgi:hypothetical protein
MAAAVWSIVLDPATIGRYGHRLTGAASVC